MPEGSGNVVTITQSTENLTGVFGKIKYDKPGKYEYTVTEAGTVKGVTNDGAAATGKKVTVTVVDNGDGTLTATADSTAEKPYPTHFPWDLLRVMRENDNVCNYLDIALQHITDRMLSRMKRNVTKEETYDLIRRLRAEVPGIHIRTTLMVGFPGETEEDFDELMEFTRWARFERMGAFAYSEEDGTYSAKHYTDDVPEEVKRNRLDRLMSLQQEISAELEAEKVGRVLKVIIDRREGDWYIGRTEFSSPEVDPEVLIPAYGRRLQRGRFYDVRITDSEEFDLYGEVVEKRNK